LLPGVGELDSFGVMNPHRHILDVAMKRTSFLLIAAALSGCTKSTRYDYETFVWPDDGYVLYHFHQPGEQSWQWETNDTRSLAHILILAGAHGWEYAGAVGHTCILRKPYVEKQFGDIDGSLSVIPADVSHDIK
jgi:hypothetical protein